jgi:hypothetical protein
LLLHLGEVSFANSFADILKQDFRNLDSDLCAVNRIAFSFEFRSLSLQVPCPIFISPGENSRGQREEER